jgi:hypothetical protein
MLALTSATAFCLQGYPLGSSAFAAACTRIASTDGSDSAPGTEAQPYRTAQRLVDSLAPGETGCLRAGTYAENVTISGSGSAGAPLTITSSPGERATIAGKLWVPDSANFVTVSSLNLDGRNAHSLPSPAVSGDDVRFVDNDVTSDNTSICFDLGPTTYGRAYRAVIERNRIHNCGKLPPTNLGHGIYVEHSTGARITENLIYDNADRGVQLYPDAQLTYVDHNVIDGNGEGVLIAGGNEDYGPQASSDSLIEHNVITYSTQRHNVEYHWGSPIVGGRNVVRNNCIYGGALDADNHGISPQVGFTAYDNVMAEPRFVDRAAKDFGLRSDSPCLASWTQAENRSGAARPQIILSSARSTIRPGGRLPLRGRVIAAKPPRFIRLRAQRGGHWQRVMRIRVRKHGRFYAHLRVRRIGPLGLRSKGRPNNGRRLRLSASATGIGRSNTVRIRVRAR